LPGPASPDPDSGGSAVLVPYFQECLRDLALIRTTLETLDLFPGDTDLEAELRPSVEDARLRLIKRLQEIDCRVTDGSGVLSDAALREFHRAMVDVSRRGMPWITLEHWMGSASLSPPEARSVFRYPLPLRHLHDDPCDHAPTALLRRIVEDLIDELSTDGNLTSEAQFTRGIYQKLACILFACLVGASPVLTDEG
jgi:hypothetical protein